jgi:hypothetical protein
MKKRLVLATGIFWLATSAAWAQQRDLSKIIAPLEEQGFTQIFDGISLDGKGIEKWNCDKDFWRAEGGEIIGETSADHQPKQNIFCIWTGAQPADFDLRLQYKLTGKTGNSGIQYRSAEMPEVAPWVLRGYQADIDGEEMFTGQVYEERIRGFVALRGQIVYIPDGGKPGWVGTLGNADDLKNVIKNGDWNDLEIIARGTTLIQLINGRVMSILIDDDRAHRKLEGEIGIQLHKTQAAMKIETRNIRIKNF